MFSSSYFFFKYFFRKLLLWLERREVVVAGKCTMCGRCCRKLNLTLGHNWIRSRRQFAAAQKKHPKDYERFEIVGRAGGALTFRCRLLDENDMCSDHENKPHFCTKYPTADLYCMGGELLSYCGYRFEFVPSFQKMLNKEMERPSQAGTEVENSSEKPHTNL